MGAILLIILIILLIGGIPAFGVHPYGWYPSGGIGLVLIILIILLLMGRLQMTGAPWWVLPGLAVFVLVIFGGALVASCFIGNETLQTTMFTAAVAMGGVATNYFFGSSAGSSKKDDALVSRVTNQPPQP